MRYAIVISIIFLISEISFGLDDEQVADGFCDCTDKSEVADYDNDGDIEIGWHVEGTFEFHEIQIDCAGDDDYILMAPGQYTNYEGQHLNTIYAIHRCSGNFIRDPAYPDDEYHEVWISAPSWSPLGGRINGLNFSNTLIFCGIIENCHFSIDEIGIDTSAGTIIKNCTFEGDGSSIGVKIENSMMTTSYELRDCIFTPLARAISIDTGDSAGTVRIIDCDIYNCINGAINSTGYHNLEIRGCRLEENETFYDGVNAAGISILNPFPQSIMNVSISDCEIINNSNNQYLAGSGGIWIQSNCPSDSINISRCNFIGNMGNYGGAIGSQMTAPASLILDDCKITGNWSESMGGGIWAQNPILLRDCQLENNISVSGGGFWGDYIDAENCIIRGNQANEGDGGGISGYNGCRLVNCVITQNTAYSTGGISCFGGTNSQIINCTITNNASLTYGDGGAYLNLTGLTIANTLFWGNTAVSGRNQINSSWNQTTIYNSDIQGTNINSGYVVEDSDYVRIGINGNGNKDEDPKLLDDYHLGEDSTCINSGNNNFSSTYDIDDEPRIAEDIIDIGADEVQHSPLAWWKLDDGTGITALDSMGNLNGQLNNGPIWTNGILDGGLSLDGTNDYVNIADDPSLRFIETDSFTISFWAKPVSTGELVCKMRTGEQYGIFGYEVQWYAEYGAFIFYAEESGNYYTGTGTAYMAAPAGSWYFVTCVYDNRAMRIYLNGEFQNDCYFASENATTPPDHSLTIGVRSYDSTLESYFGGIIDDVRVYRSALTADEIEQLYLAGN